MNRLLGRKGAIGRYQPTNLLGLKSALIPNGVEGRRRNAEGAVNTENFINRIFVLLNAITSEDFILKDVYSKILQFDTDTKTIGDFNKILSSAAFLKFNELDPTSAPLISGLNTREMLKNEGGRRITSEVTGLNVLGPGLPDTTPISNHPKIVAAIKRYQYNAYNELIAMIQISVGTLVVGAFDKHPSLKQTFVGKKILELHDGDGSLTKFMRDIGKSNIYDNPAFDRQTWDRKIDNILRTFLPIGTIEYYTNKLTEIVNTLRGIYMLPIYFFIYNTIDQIIQRHFVSTVTKEVTKEVGVLAMMYMSAGLALQVAPPVVIGVLGIVMIHFTYIYRHFKIGFWKRTKENLLDIYGVIFNPANKFPIRADDDHIKFRKMNEAQKDIFLREGPEIANITRKIDNSKDFLESNQAVFQHFLRMLSGMTQEEIEARGVWEQATLAKSAECKKKIALGKPPDCDYTKEEEAFIDNSVLLENSLRPVIEDLNKANKRNVERESNRSVAILKTVAPWLIW